MKPSIWRGSAFHKTVTALMALALALIPVLGVYQPAQAAITSGTIVTLDGSTPPITVAAGATISVVFSATTNSNTNWRGTLWEFGDDTPDTCVDTPNFDTNPGGTNQVTFNVTAPTGSGPATLYVRANSDNGCGGTSGPVANAGVVVESVATTPNPDLPLSCGTDIVLILDESYSIVNGGITSQIRDGAKAMILALQDTGSNVAVVEFNTNARRAVIGGSTAYQPITSGYLTNFNSYINTDGNTSASDTQYDPEDYGNPNYYTNWEAALRQAYDIGTNGSNPRPLVVFFTDGDPTAKGYPTGIVVGTTASQMAESLAAAVPAANTLKGSGSHIFVVGVPNPNVAESNVIAVSGPDKFPVPESNVGVADYTISSAANFADALKTIVTQLCGVDVKVTKLLDDDNDPATPAEPATGASVWTFSGDVEVPANTSSDFYTWQLPNPAIAAGAIASANTNANGLVNFGWVYNLAPGKAQKTDKSKIVITETPKDNYLMSGVACPTQAGAILTPNVAGNAFTLDNISISSSLTCNVTNVKKPKVLTDVDCSLIVPAPGAQSQPIIVGELINQDTARVTGAQMSIKVVGNFSFSPTGSTINNVSSNIPTGCVLDAGDATNKTALCTPTDGVAPGNTTWRVEITVVPGSSSPTPVDITATFTSTGTLFQTGSYFSASCGGTTPVELSYFEATPTGSGVHFEWSTASESRNMGFNLYVETPDGPVKLNSELIPSAVVDSLQTTDYSYDAGVSGGSFSIEDIDAAGKPTRYGPFALGEAQGARFASQPIPWDAIHAELAANAAQQQQAVAAGINDALGAARSAEDDGPIVEHPAFIESDPVQNPLFLPWISSTENAGEMNAAALPPIVNLLVDQTSLYRITYEQLRDSGFDLAGIRAEHIAITNQGQPAHFSLFSRRTFGPGAYIEFYGQALDTLYTGTAVYQLQVNRGLTSLGGLNIQTPDLNAAPPAFYMETSEVNDNVIYTAWSVNEGDPWYKNYLYSTGRSVSGNNAIEINDMVAGAGVPATLNVNLYGFTTDPLIEQDHHVQLAFNDQLLPSTDIRFDGRVGQPISSAVDPQIIQNGVNQVKLTLPGDTGSSLDMVALDDYSLTYPRALVARDGSLNFEVQAAHIRVNGLPSGDLHIYRINEDNGQLVRISNLVIEQTGDSFSVSLRGREDHNDTYLVYAGSALLTPGIKGIGQANQIAASSGHNYIVIAHPSFINGDLQRLVDARTQQGYSVSVVNVLDLYDRYTHGVLDPEAIRSFIAEAAAQGGEYFLLVGGDCLDYRNYQNNCISFIPTFYRPTGAGDAFTSFTPADPVFVDLNGDNVPDRIISRMPVRTAEELRVMVDKTLIFDAADYPVDAIIGADTGFIGDSESFISDLPEEWTTERAYVSAGLSGARATLISSLNSGARLAGYVGHSGGQSWSFSGLFRSPDVAGLTNAGLPSLVIQWGCNNTYFVEPAYNTMAQQFMIANQQAGPSGAAAVLGASTLTLSDAERLMGEILIPKLVEPGMTVGQALLEAKQELALTHPEYTDVLLGYQFLGDGALMLNMDKSD